jgi:hypothetical protein
VTVSNSRPGCNEESDTMKEDFLAEVTLEVAGMEEKGGFL